MTYIILLLGFVFLIKGADLFVDGASALSKKMGIPSVIIGLTVVAFGTSLPEAAVSVTASLNGSSGISIGNVVGSNLFNLLVVAGSSAIFSAVAVNKQIIKKDFPFSIVSTFALLFLAYNIFTNPVSDMVLSSADGMVLLLFFAIFMFYTVKAALSSPADEDENNVKDMPLWKQLLFIALGITAICLGGKFVVDSASDIARTFGLTEGLIGLTIAAVGTSLPELVTSIVAAKKGENDIAMGNVIGSNIFNILFVMGVASLIRPVAVDITSMYDIGILIISSLIIYLFTLRKREISRPLGITMVLAYFVYLVYIVMR